MTQALDIWVRRADVEHCIDARCWCNNLLEVKLDRVSRRGGVYLQSTNDGCWSPHALRRARILPSEFKKFYRLKIPHLKLVQ